MYTVRVKICGLRSVDSVAYAAQAGADAVGIVFYAPSPRFVGDLGLARELCLAAGPFVSTVGLFVDASPGDIEKVLHAVPLSNLQFHGLESEQDCLRFQRPYIKALRMKPGEDITRWSGLYPSAQGILLDAYRPGVPGGTGETFDWQSIPANMNKPLILAGGLTVNNVESAIRTVQPWAIDVSGGVESAPGLKSPNLVGEFIRLAKSVVIPSNNEEMQ